MSFRKNTNIHYHSLCVSYGWHPGWHNQDGLVYSRHRSVPAATTAAAATHRREPPTPTPTPSLKPTCPNPNTPSREGLLRLDLS